VLAAGVGLAATAAVAACGAGGSGRADSGGAGSGGAGSAGSSSAAGGQTIVQLADVPVGGAISAKAPGGAAIIVVQPTAGQAVAFSARCTHMGCTVAPAGKELDCPCHGSVYDLTGKNIAGPAPRPLSPFAVTVKDGAVVAS
jgi:Rieske Fe-S protein